MKTPLVQGVSLFSGSLGNLKVVIQNPPGSMPLRVQVSPPVPDNDKAFSISAESLFVFKTKSGSK